MNAVGLTALVPSRRPTYLLGLRLELHGLEKLASLPTMVPLRLRWKTCPSERFLVWAP